MKVLIVGAGAIGSVFADKLHRAGHDVSMLARGARLVSLQEHGLVVQDHVTQETSFCHVATVSELRERDQYDLIIVAVPTQLIPALLPVLGRNISSRSILFIANTAEGYADWRRAVGKARLMLGFAGFAGELTGSVVRYARMPSWLRVTTIAESDGAVTERLIAVGSTLRAAGIPTTYSRDMRASQLTHLAMILPVVGAIAIARSIFLLPLRDDVLDLMIRAIREEFRVLDALRIAVTPKWMNSIRWLPRATLKAVLRRLCGTEAFATATTHFSAAREEVERLSAEFRLLVENSGIPTPALDQLMSRVRPLAPEATASVAA